MKSFKMASDGKKVEVIQLAARRAQGHVRRGPAGRPEDARRPREGRHQGCQGGLSRRSTSDGRTGDADRVVLAAHRQDRPRRRALLRRRGAGGPDDGHHRRRRSAATSSTRRSTARSISSIVLLVLAVSCAIGYGGRTGAHVTADMVTTVVGPTFEWISGVVHQGRSPPASRRSGRGGCSSPERPRPTRRKHAASEHPVRADLQGALHRRRPLRGGADRRSRRAGPPRREVPLLVDESRAMGSPE